MKIVYRSHAVERMFERAVPPEQVQAILEAPDGVIRQSRDKVVVYRTFGDRADNAIGVVAVANEDFYEVLTVLVGFSVAPRDQQ